MASKTSAQRGTINDASGASIGQVASITSETQQIEYTSSLPRRDPNWSAICRCGHVNAWETIRWVTTGTYWCDECADEHDEGEYRCARCDEAATPALIGPSPYPQYLPGLTTVRLTLSGNDRRPSPGDTVSFNIPELASGSAIVTEVSGVSDNWTANAEVTGLLAHSA